MPGNSRLRRSCILPLLLLLSFPAILNAQQAHPEYVLRLSPVACAKAQAKGVEMSIDKVLSDGEVLVYAGRESYLQLAGLGIPFHEEPVPSLSIIPLMRSQPSAADTTWDFYPTYDYYEAAMQQLASDHPGLCRLHEIAQLGSGRRLLSLVISDQVDSLEAEPRFLYTSSMHGDEVVGYVLLLRLAAYLLNQYGIDPEVTSLLNHTEIWINPLANPNGTYRNGNHTVSGATRGNANSVDLNRNYPDPEDGPHPDNKAWQEETVAFMALADSLPFDMAANIHGGAEVCNYPWDTWSRLHPDDAWWFQVCSGYADTAQFYSPSGYFNDFGTGVTNGYAWYSISGGRQDYMNYFHQCREFTLEISDNKMPPASQLPAFWEYNHRSLFQYMQQSMYGIRGQVRDSLSQLPLRAKVEIPGHDQDSSHVWSRSTGDYYRYLAPGNYTMVFSAPGYLNKMVHNVAYQQGQQLQLDVELVPTSQGREETRRQYLIWYDPLAGGLRTQGLTGGHIEVFSVSGGLIGRWAADSGPFMPMGNLPAGIYLARYLTGDGDAMPWVMRFIHR